MNSFIYLGISGCFCLRPLVASGMFPTNVFCNIGHCPWVFCNIGHCPFSFDTCCIDVVVEFPSVSYMVYLLA